MSALFLYKFIFAEATKDLINDHLKIDLKVGKQL